jgi:hypothetical protein
MICATDVAELAPRYPSRMKLKPEDPNYFDMLVDVMVYDTTSSKPPRVRSEVCRATPKRIYTPGGAVYDRSTGKQIMALAHRVSMTFKRKALPETLRKAGAA